MSISVGQKTLFTTECDEEPLTGTAIYFMRASTKKSLGEEAFQREILVGPLNMQSIDNLIWQTERTITKIFLPFLNSKFITEKVNKPMNSKIRKDLLPCLRSYGRFGVKVVTIFNLKSKTPSFLRIAEDVLKEGVLIKEFPPESFTIRCLDDAWDLLKNHNGQEK